MIGGNRRPARDSPSGAWRDAQGGQGGVCPVGFCARCRGGIPDIFIPPAVIDNGGVRGGRNENSGMTMGAGVRCRVLAGVDRSGRGCNPRPARSGASRDAFPSGAWERQGGDDKGGDRTIRVLLCCRAIIAAMNFSALPRVVLPAPEESGAGRWLVFSRPRRILAASEAGEVPQLLREVDSEIAKGSVAAGFVCYEAAPAFDMAQTVRPLTLRPTPPVQPDTLNTSESSACVDDGL